MSQLSTQPAFEEELEDEFEVEGEWETEDEDEDFLGGLANIASSLLGEGEEEAEDEWEVEGEAEWEAELEGEDEDEAFFGPLMKIAGSLIGGGGDGEGEWESEWEGEGEGEAEAEAEEFFRKIGGFLYKNRALFKKIAKVAGPMVATAVGGPAAGMLARAVTSQLEGELEDELEGELEEMATAPVNGAQALGEYLAARAASAESEDEAEAFAGAAITIALSRRDRRDIERMLPHLLRGAAVLTRLLRSDPNTRQGVRLLPGIVDGAAGTLVRRRAAGYPADVGDVGRVLAGSTSRVLGDPQWRNAVTRRHARGLAYGRRRLHRGHAGYRGYRGPRGYGQSGGRRYATSGRSAVVRRRPVHTHVVGRGARVPRPRQGFVRVVTPVRVPARGGVPARTVRVVSDVRVPRGAVPAGRPASVAPRRRGR